MVDTVQIFRAHEIGTTIPPGYKVTHHDVPVPGSVCDPKHLRNCSFDHLATGYHSHGDTYTLNYHRVSLPRLLHEDNGKLITNQEQLDASMLLFHQKTCELGIPQYDSFHFTRVDLTWQFLGDAAQFVQAHLHAPHPRIRSEPILYANRSLALAGSELRIAIYDNQVQTGGACSQ